MQFKVGDRVEYISEGKVDARGVITHTLGKKFEVTWSDGEAYTYEDWPGGSIRHRTDPSHRAIKVRMKV